MRMWDTSTSSDAASGAWYTKPRVIRRKLKSLFILRHEFDFKNNGDDRVEELEDEHMDWLINEEMAPKFGDGNYYSFELNDGHNNQYTHMHDGYLYHELWFIDEKCFNEVIEKVPVIKLDEEDFLL